MPNYASRKGKKVVPLAIESESILLVDDEPHLRSSVSAILEAAGYEVYCAENGCQAISLLEERPYALALLDINLPDISGQKVLEAVVDQNSDTSVVMLSGESSFAQATRAMRKGAEDFLAKPCAPEKLLETVSNCLEKRHRRLMCLKVQQQLQGSEELHRFIVNHSPDLIFLLDDQGRLTFLNERSEYFLGCPVDESLGRHFTEFVVEDDLAKIEQVLNHLQGGMRSLGAAELRLRTANDHTVRHVEVWAVPVELTALEVYDRPGRSSEQKAGSYCIARDISDRRQAEELRRFHLYHDQLTSLPNRTLFNDRLKIATRQAKRQGQKLAVMFLDIDRFKLINDSLGHLAGDELLQAVAQKLKSCLREGDTLARISGDEFNLLLPNISDIQGASAIAEKIQNAFAHPLKIQGKQVRVTFSIGCAVYPDHGENKDVLLRNADVSMYRVKETGRNGFVCYSGDMKCFNSYYLEIENSLHRALRNDELQLYYQPQYDMFSKKIVGLEALIRWQHPQKGLLLPADFIAIAEQSKLVCSIGEWVLHQACRDAVTLKELGFKDLQLAVNISPQHLEMDGFARSVIETIRHYPLDVSFLEIEITENSLMHDIGKSKKTLSFLADQGVTITVDDFGTGYSSLSYLQNLPLHTLKIDRSFVKNLTTINGSETIITAVLGIAKGMNLNFIAEGVETEQQHNYLIKAGCSFAQGFFYSRPLCFAELLSCLESEQPRQRHNHA